MDKPSRYLILYRYEVEESIRSWEDRVVDYALDFQAAKELANLEALKLGVYLTSWENQGGWSEVYPDHLAHTWRSSVRDKGGTLHTFVLVSIP
jgi:hypothetical protein